MTDQQTSQLVEAIFKLSRTMKGRMSFTSDIAHLSMLQMQAIIFINKHPNVTMGEIAAQFKIELPSATSLMAKLCKAEIAERNADAEDRRIVRIALTKKGKELFAEAMRERTKKVESILSYLALEDKKDLLRIIQGLLSHMEEEDEG